MDRKKLILQLRKEGKTYDVIGKLFNISRQRVHQIISHYYSPYRRSPQYRYKEYKRDFVKMKERRALVLGHYGGNPPKCAECRYENFDALDIDHIKNDGKEHRIIVKNLYKWLVKNNFPKGYQVLCRNCNWLKHLKFSKQKRELEYKKLFDRFDVI